MVTVEVTNANGRKCQVIIAWKGTTPSNGWTDSNGRVNFGVNGGRGSIHVDGQELKKDVWIGGTVQVSKR